MTWDPPSEVEEYRIVRPLGRGTMGQVYLAHDALLDRAVAIKFVGAAEVGPAERERFFTEARAIARLSHPNVVAIHRVGEVRKRPYLVSEYVRGTPLDKLARPIAWERALDIGQALARGLAEAHRHGVLHRDIKPANVVVGDDGEAKLLDFGLAKLVDASAPVAGKPITPIATAVDETVSIMGRVDVPLSPQSPIQTEAGQIMGTPLYLAPELWRGEPASTRSDVYAVGLLLYEMVTGTPPHAGKRFAELQELVQKGAPPVTGDLPAGFAALIDACVALDPAMRPANGDALSEALDGLRAKPIAYDGNPYRGLATFEREHRAVFFGRAREVRQVVDRLRVEPLVVVAGDSGAGKSSLCRAGVVPALADAGWRVVSFVPGPRPLTALDALEIGDGDTLVFVDQLEELLTVADEEEAALVAERLAELASGRVRVLATARADFLGRLAALPGLGDALSRALVLLGPLGERGLREAIVGPARALGYTFESDATVDELVASGRANLPLLQFALAELWDVRDDGAKRIPADALARIGGVAGALARHADQVMAGLGDDRDVAWRVLVALMTAEGTRAVRTRAELAADHVVERLVRARLLQITDDRVEVIHEALFSAWPRLVAWRRAHDADARLRDQLADAAKQWQARGRPRGLLWRDDALAEYRAWRKRWHELTAIEAAFGDASEAEARRTRRFRGLAIAAVVLGLASGLVVLYRARGVAERQNRTLLGQQAIHELASGHGTRALPYLVELLRAGDDTPANHFLVADAVRPIDAHVARVVQVDAGLTGMSLSPDGDRLAVTDFNGVVRLFTADGAAVVTLEGHRDRAFAPLWGGGGAWLATASGDGDVRVWDVAGARTRLVLAHGVPFDTMAVGGDRIATTKGTDAFLWDATTGARIASVRNQGGVALSADGKLLASGATLYDGATGAPLGSLTDTPCGATFGHVGHHLALHCEDRTLRIFDGDRPVATVRAIGTEYVVVSWSGDDTRIVTAVASIETKVWDASTGELVSVFPDRAHAATLDGTGAAAGALGQDNVFRVYDVATGQLRVSVETAISSGRGAHAPPGLQGVLLSRDGTRLYTESATRIDVWRAAQSSLALALPFQSANSVGVSPDHRRIAIGGGGGRAQIRDAKTGELLRELPALGDLVYDINFSPDGTRLVLAGINNGVRIVEPDNRVRVLATGTVNRASFSPDGTRVVAAGSDPNARIYDASTGALVHTLAGHAQRVMAAVYSPDGTRIASTGWDGTVRTWDATTFAPIAVLTAPSSQFLEVSWSPDGRTLASGGHSGELILWDVATGARRLLVGHVGAITNVSWSADGALLATSSTDLTARIWDVATGNLLATRTGFRGSVDACQWVDDAHIATASEDNFIRVWDVHRDSRGIDELADLVEQHVPWQLVDGRLEPTDR